jgi:acylphosphatase
VAPAVHLLVSGRVQGVGFRWFVRTLALRLDLAGWVMNLPDGTVEIAAQGSDAQLEEFLNEVRRGPDGADVSRVDVLAPSNDALACPFAVRRDR